MSVQAGIWNFDGKPVDRELWASLNQALAFEASSRDLSYFQRNIAILYRPLHTTAESHREKQPHCSRRGFVITWDGRLDNREELIASSCTDLDRRATDVEIVAALFDIDGTDCFHKIIGDWALSIWKPEPRELIFAVDYMSIRHIFYHLENDRILWSTELAPLVLISGKPLHIDDAYVAGYFAHDPNADLTPYREIREVPPGQFLRIRGCEPSATTYWRFDRKSDVRYQCDAEYEDHFRTLFRQSVRRRLRSVSPVLAELSGGLDSSSIVCMADDVMRKEGGQTPRLDTLSYYDKSEPHGDDCLYFPIIEKKRDRVGHRIDVSRASDVPAQLKDPEFVPVPGYLGYGRQLETQRAVIVRNGDYRVIISGVGGDEFLGGVPNPSAHLADLILQFRLIDLGKQLLAWSLVKRRPAIHLLRDAGLELMPSYISQHWQHSTRIESWLDERFAKRVRAAHRKSRNDLDSCLPSRRAYIDGLLLMARRMAKRDLRPLVAAETRYPYLDRDLIEFLLAVPPEQLLRPHERRSLMRRSLVGLVPQEILSRRTKQTGERAPAKALASNWNELQTCFDSLRSGSMGFIAPEPFLAAIRDAINGKSVHIVKLMKAVSLEFWLQDVESRGLVVGGNSRQLLTSQRTLFIEDSLAAG